MKTSIYNSYININSRHTLIYNSFKGSFVVVRDQLWDGEKIKNEVSKDKPHDKFYNQLCEAGILINDEIDESVLLKNRIDLADNNTSEFILHINPTLDCNFKCWYCYENHIPRSLMKEETLKSIQNLISNILSDDKIKTFDLGFFGGEPLLYFNKISKPIIDFAESICRKKSKDLHIHFTTNGSLLTQQTIEYLSRFNCGFQITLDGGKEMHDKTRFYKNGGGSFEKIICNIIKLLTAGLTVIVRINYTSKNVDSVAQIKGFFENLSMENRKYLRFDFQRVWQDKDLEDNTEEKIKKIRKTFREDGFSVLANYIPRDIRESCYGDKVNHALINYNGDVFGCTARDFTHQNRIGVLAPSGNIIYDKEKYDLRMNSKFSKPICRKCRIAPVCGGGCRQRALEAVESPLCSMGYSEADIDGIVTEIFEHTFGLNPK